MSVQLSADQHTIVSDLPPGVNHRHFDDLGTIEVLVLRCQTTNPAQSEMSSPSSGEHSLLMSGDMNAAQEGERDSDPINEPSIGNREPEQEESGFGAMFGLFDGPSDYPPGYYGRRVTPPSRGYQSRFWGDTDGRYERQGPYRPAGPSFPSQQAPSQPQYFRPEPDFVHHHHQNSSIPDRNPPYTTPNYGPSKPERRVHFDQDDSSNFHERQYGRHDHIPHHFDQDTYQGNPTHACDRVNPEYQEPEPHPRTANPYADHAFPSDAHYTYDADNRAYHGHHDRSQMNGNDWPSDGPVHVSSHPGARSGQPGHQSIPVFGQQPRYTHQQPRRPLFQVQHGPWVSAQPNFRPQPIPIVFPPNLIPVPHPVTGLPVYPQPNPAPFFPGPPPFFGPSYVHPNAPQQTSTASSAPDNLNTSGADHTTPGGVGTNDLPKTTDPWLTTNNDLNCNTNNQPATGNNDSNNTTTNNGDDWKTSNNDNQNNSGAGWDNTVPNQNSNGNDWNTDSNKNDDGGDWGNTNNQANETGNGGDWDNTHNHNNQTSNGEGWETNNNNNQASNGDGWDNTNNNNHESRRENNNANQNNSGSGGGGSGWNDNNQNNNWNNNQATHGTGNSDPTPTRTKTGRQSLYGPHGAYLTSKAFAAVEIPADAEEEPLYDVPQAIAQDRGTSKQVQPGKGYLYNKKRCAPKYIDAVEEPYARFVFKYRTKEQIKNETGVEITAEPTGDEQTNALEQLDKTELIQMVLRAKGALGGQIPAPSPKDTAGQTPTPSFEQVPVPPPEISFLKYNLPPGRAVSNPGLGIKNTTNNGSSNQPDQSWDNNQQPSGRQNWESQGINNNNNNTTSGDNWANKNSGGGASGWYDNTQNNASGGNWETAPNNNNNNNNNNAHGMGAGWDGQQESKNNTTTATIESNQNNAATENNEFTAYLATLGAPTGPGPSPPDWSTPAAATAPQQQVSSNHGGIQTIGTGVIGGRGGPNTTTSTSFNYTNKPPTPPLKPCSPPMNTYSTGDWSVGPPPPTGTSGGGAAADGFEAEAAVAQTPLPSGGW